ncbi:transcriptional regulator [Vespertiliibacter pulmonis]|uniref:Putative DNA-binding transcriptional regulator YafY n=1 Tax=Vespertiliibacter pulmonis TaxID=1443036 RepID=A0A3N4VKC5_9PAST|nr:WYL domain-containing protein [Vespertiliibacter pulmonis]QLB20889.1 transcriptional regulator [Vespertiliibacter pulmonis]RPE83542.1 putative DNA-binding transcriptional regulator YafY [Vespertiliibacter pulmonis]
MSKNKKNEKVAQRLVAILTDLNMGERLNVADLAERFNVTPRTIQKDLNERFSLLKWKECEQGYYSLDLSQLGHLSQKDIERFANFASIQDLLPKIDRKFFQDNLIQSIQIKGFQYEDIKNKQKEFNDLQKAIEQQSKIHFYYQKLNDNTGKNYELEPYSLVNKNGIWYLIGLDNGKEKTFCFTQIKMLIIKNEKFELDPKFLQEIKKSDSISHGNQLNQVVIKVSAKVSAYFLRRNLLPNQEIIEKLDDGSLLLQCRNINEMEIIPLVQYWIPHLHIISPEWLQDDLIEQMKNYINN